MIKDHILVWNNCLDLIRKSISSQPFKTWFEPIKPVKLAGEVITIEVPNKFFYEWLEEHYVDILRKAVKNWRRHQRKIKRYRSTCIGGTQINKSICNPWYKKD